MHDSIVNLIEMLVSKGFIELVHAQGVMDVIRTLDQYKSVEFMPRRGNRRH